MLKKSQRHNPKLQARQAYREHLSGYQRRDYEVSDYQMYELAGTRLSFRGPPPSDFASGNYFTCIGAAQTFGCCCERPFPTLLAERFQLPVLNLGYGGAGPEFFERHESLDRYINGGKFLILQVMSGRSQSNSVFECRGLEYLTRRADGLSLSAYTGYEDLLYGVPAFRDDIFGKSTPFIRRKFRGLLRRLVVTRLIGAPRTRRIVEETRRAWIESYRRLLSRIEVPVILFWISKRSPDYTAKYNSVSGFFGEFPHFVNSEMIAELKALCESHVECISKRGSPQPLFSRFTGKPVTVDPALDRPDFGGTLWTHNQYYPSPEMHEDAAAALSEACAEFVATPLQTS